jgi:hypothetical protein
MKSKLFTLVALGALALGLSSWAAAQMPGDVPDFTNNGLDEEVNRAIESEKDLQDHYSVDKSATTVVAVQEAAKREPIVRSLSKEEILRNLEFQRDHELAEYGYFCERMRQMGDDGDLRDAQDHWSKYVQILAQISQLTEGNGAEPQRTNSVRSQQAPTVRAPNLSVPNWDGK